METGPATALIVTEPDFLLEVLVITLDAPAHLGEVDQPPEFKLLIDAGEPIFRGLFLTRRPLGVSLPAVPAGPGWGKHGPALEQSASAIARSCLPAK